MFKLFIPALAALSLAVPGQAEVPGTTTVSVTVSFADLDLASEEGAATLHARIAAAVDKVCSRPALDDKGPSWEACRKKAMDGAMQQLAALHIDTPLLASAR